MTSGPIKVPDELMEDWYVRFKNVAKAVYQRDHGIGCNPKDQSFMRDMMERLAEDEDWLHEDLPILVVHRSIPEGTFVPVENAAATAKAVSLNQMMKSQRGLGRFTGVTLPRNGEISNPFRKR